MIKDRHNDDEEEASKDDDDGQAEAGRCGQDVKRALDEKRQRNDANENDANKIGAGNMKSHGGSQACMSWETICKQLHDCICATHTRSTDLL